MGEKENQKNREIKRVPQGINLKKIKNKINIVVEKLSGGLTVKANQNIIESLFTISLRYLLSQLFHQNNNSQKMP